MVGYNDGKIGAVDLDRMSVQELTALIAAAEAKRAEKREEAVAALRAEMERKAAELGISAGELFPPAARQETTGQETFCSRQEIGLMTAWARASTTLSSNAAQDSCRCLPMSR